MKDSVLYLLDTNTTGYILRRKSQQASLLLKDALQRSRVAISTVTQAEILYGFERNPEAHRLRDATEQFFRSIEVLDWDSEAAGAYARLRNHLRVNGKSLEDADLFIASHALSLGAVLVSHDQAFEHVKPFLTVEDWAHDLV